MIYGLILSIIINIFLLWYLKKVLQNLLYVSENIGDLFQSLSLFSEHLKSVNQMETYYGDEILQKLVDHSKIIVGEVETFEDIYKFSVSEEEYLEEEQEVGVEQFEEN